MLNIASNPYSEPIKKFIHDLKVTEWKFPFILQVAHAVITSILLLLLLVFYVTIGIISQISNSFWNLITGLGDKMSFSNPIESSFYALSATIYFFIFLPFFIVQSPIWLGGWFASKIGFRPFIIILVTLLLSVGLFFFQPRLATSALEKIINVQNSIRSQYFASDTLRIKDNEIIKSNLQEK